MSDPVKSTENQAKPALTTDASKLIAESYQNGRNHLESMCADKGVPADQCSASTFIGATLNQREAEWRKTEAAICADGKANNLSMDDLLSKYGFAEGTKLSCSAVDSDLQPNHGVSARGENQKSAEVTRR